MILTKDSLRLGIVLGFLAPFLGMFVFYLWKASSIPFGVFFDTVMHNKPFLTTMISVSLLANAILFTLYINTRKDRTAKGIFIITVVYAVATLIFKLFLL